MRLIWHIAKKDIRRMAPPVALWLAFMLATAVWFAVSAGTGMVLTSGDVEGWMRMVNAFVALMLMIHLVLPYFIVGAMVVEEPLVGSSAFWMTRPISNVGRAASTGLAALILFVVAPLALLSMVWLGCGFSLPELSSVAADFVATQFAVVIVALAVGSLSRNLAQFLFCSVGLLIVYFLCRAPLLDSPGYDEHSWAVRHSRGVLIGAAFYPTMVAIAAHQFFTRRPLRSWVMVGVAIAAGFSVRLAWPWDSGDVLDWERWADKLDFRRDNRVDHGVVVQVQTAVKNGWQHWPVALQAETAATNQGFFVPLDGTALVPTNRGKFESIAHFKLAGLRDEDIADLVLGRSTSTAHWTLAGLDSAVSRGSAAEVDTVRAVVTGRSARVLGVDQIPIHPAELRIGARRTRIVSVESKDDGGIAILLQDRDAFPNRNIFIPNLMEKTPISGPHQDVFAIVDPATHEAHALKCDRLAAVELDSMIAGFRRVEVPAEFRSDRWRDATVVRVRLEYADRFSVQAEVKLANSENHAP